MAADFIPAQELKKRYAVLSHFYDVVLSQDMRIRCRSVLEIFAKTLTGDVRKSLPDAIFVMMNPGSSRPLVGSPVKVKRGEERALSKTVIPTKPDTTQYQLMRVMECMGWRHVRVLNLSDLREPKGRVFEVSYIGLEQAHSFMNHSIFAEERRSELKAELQRKPGAPIICAWGVSPRLMPLIRRALHALGEAEMLCGLEVLGDAGKYLHPLPALQKDQREWLRKMIAHLTNDGA